MKRKKELNESVRATFKDGTTQEFSSIQEASMATGLTETSIKSRCNSGTGAKSKDGITFIWADEHTRKSKQAKRNKSKGNGFELELVKGLKECGYEGVVSARSQNKMADANKIHIVDMNGELPFNLQAKYTQNLPNYFTIRDECTDKEKPFCMAWKKATNNGSQSPGTVVVIPLEYFYKLIKR